MCHVQYTYNPPNSSIAANPLVEARRVKCGEEKPICRRCHSGGRFCSYHDPKPRKRLEPLTFINYAALVVPSTAHSPGGDKLQLRAFAYFRERTARDLAGPVWQDSFFTGILLAIADSEPTVRHAITALGALHEFYGESERTEVASYALSQYGKAIKGVVELETTEQSVEVVLTSCILFALLESMRGFHHSSMSHLVSGLKVLRENQMSGRFPSATSSALSQALQWLFIRADSQLMDCGGAKFGHGVQVYQPMEYFLPATLRDISESSFHIDLLHNRVMYVLSRWEPIISIDGQTASVMQELNQEKSYYRGELDRFHAAHLLMVSRTSPLSHYGDVRAGHLAVSLAIKVTAILLEVDDFVNPEKGFDKSLPLFKAMVDEAEEFIEISPGYVSPFVTPPHTVTSDATNSSTTSSENTGCFEAGAIRRPILTMSSGCVLPLYFVAARCRHSATRHRALRLLKTCKRREGLWDSALAAGIAERLIAIEESKAKALLRKRQLEAAFDTHNNSLYNNIDWTPTKTDHSESSADELDVPDEARIRTVVMHYDRAEDTGRAEFSMQPPWSVIPGPGNRFEGLRSIENIAFGTPGPRAVVTEVLMPS